MALNWKKTDLPTLADKKIQMANESCQALIYAGIDVELSGGTEHFALEPNDQTNIDSMFTAITLGATQYPYHADGSQCKMYVAADIMTLYVAYKSFVTYQTTYNNFLKIWINRETDKNALAGITYGCDLPEDLDAQMEAVLASSATQLHNVVAAVSDGAFVEKIKNLEIQMTDTQMGLCEVYELALGGEM